jgi:hypothetical protein
MKYRLMLNVRCISPINSCFFHIYIYFKNRRLKKKERTASGTDSHPISLVRITLSRGQALQLWQRPKALIHAQTRQSEGSPGACYVSNL